MNKADGTSTNNQRNTIIFIYLFVFRVCVCVCVAYSFVLFCATLIQYICTLFTFEQWESKEEQQKKLLNSLPFSSQPYTRTHSSSRPTRVQSNSAELVWLILFFSIFHRYSMPEWLHSKLFSCSVRHLIAFMRENLWIDESQFARNFGYHCVDDVIPQKT